MKRRFAEIFLIIILLAGNCRLIGQSLSEDTTFKVVAYVPNWIDLNTFSNSIDYTKITHINIAFENPDLNGNLSYNFSNTTLINKAHAKGVKVLVSIGGGSESENASARTKYFNLINDANRGVFISKIAAYIKLRNFDGIDVDLEGPAINADYGKFIRDLSDTLKPAGKLVTSALSQGYGGGNVPVSTFEYFDFVNIMAYDATGPWDKNNPGQHSSYSLADTQLKYWKGRGLKPEKAILGVPFYGYGFGTAYRNYDYPYSEIVRVYSGAENKDQVGTTVYFNGIHTIKKKTELAMQQGGGVMIWELSSDATGPKSLLLAIDGVIKGTDSIPPAPTELVATPFSTSRIDLSWKDNSPNETSFRIETSKDGLTGWKSITTVGLNLKVYSNTGLLSGNSYFYRIRAENYTGVSAYSNVVQATTLGNPTGIDVSGVSETSVQVFPNPVSCILSVEYNLSPETNVDMAIYDLQGQILKTLIKEKLQSPGYYYRTFDISSLSDGVYFARFSSEGCTKMFKLLIQK